MQNLDLPNQFRDGDYWIFSRIIRLVKSNIIFFRDHKLRQNKTIQCREDNPTTGVSFNNIQIIDKFAAFIRISCWCWTCIGIIIQIPDFFLVHPRMPRVREELGE